MIRQRNGIDLPGVSRIFELQRPLMHSKINKVSEAANPSLYIFIPPSTLKIDPNQPNSHLLHFE